MKYVFEDIAGDQFAGDTYAQVVSEMRKAAWQVPGKYAYMEEVADRVVQLDPYSQIDIRSASQFIKSLVVYQWLRRIK